MSANARATGTGKVKRTHALAHSLYHLKNKKGCELGVLCSKFTPCFQGGEA